MKLNIGSSTTIRGQYKNPEWVSIDLIKPTGRVRGRYVAGSVVALPFKDETFDEIHMIHSLEHIPRKLHPDVYKELHRVLIQEGHVFIEVPDLIQCCKEIISIWEKMPEDFSEKIRLRTLSLYGKGRSPGDYHHWGFAPEVLEKDLRDHGFHPEFWLEHISNHFKYEPVILYRGTKI